MKEMISVLCPTRERPAQMTRFLESLDKSTFKKNALEVIVYIDDDDKSAYSFSGYGFKIEKIVGPRRSMGGYNTYCLNKATGDIIILLNDDVIVKTACWDSQVRKIHQRYKDGIYLAYGNDLHKKKKISTFPILGRETCKIMVKPFPEDYSGALIDYHIFDVFKRIQKLGYHRIIYLSDLIFEHMHFRAGKAKPDETYQKRSRFQDDKVFIQLSSFRQVQAKRLLYKIKNVSISDSQSPPNNSFFQGKSIFESWAYMFRQLAMNNELPIRWRIFLFIWLYGRLLAQRGYLTLFGYEVEKKFF